MTDQKKNRLLADNKLTEDLQAVVDFLDPHLATRAKAKSTAKRGTWSWRKTIAFVLVTGLIGWSVILGMVYLLYMVMH
jgi:hypothetical protein